MKLSFFDAYIFLATVTLFSWTATADTACFNRPTWGECQTYCATAAHSFSSCTDESCYCEYVNDPTSAAWNCKKCINLIEYSDEYSAAFLLYSGSCSYASFPQCTTTATATASSIVQSSSASSAVASSVTGSDCPSYCENAVALLSQCTTESCYCDYFSDSSSDVWKCEYCYEEYTYSEPNAVVVNLDLSSNSCTFDNDAGTDVPSPVAGASSTTCLSIPEASCSAYCHTGAFQFNSCIDQSCYCRFQDDPTSAAYKCMYCIDNLSYWGSFSSVVYNYWQDWDCLLVPYSTCASSSSATSSAVLSAAAASFTNGTVTKL